MDFKLAIADGAFQLLVCVLARPHIASIYHQYYEQVLIVVRVHIIVVFGQKVVVVTATCVTLCLF